MQQQSGSIPGEEKDSYTIAVADHGVNPEPAPAAKARHISEPRSRHGDDAFGLRDLLIWCGIPVLVVLLLRLFIFGFFSIPSGSMMDTIEIGDRVITTQLTPTVFGLQRGDVIVFNDPAHWLQQESSQNGSDQVLIKRLIGLPGDTVACNGAGSPVTINGVPINESSYIRPGVDPSGFAFNVKVTPGHLFVLGDNRANSADSRYHQNDGAQGLVPISDVLGKGLFTYWPLNRLGTLNDHHDVFKNVPGVTSAK